VISSPGNLEICHPFCRVNPVEKWPGAGSQDSIHYYSGLVFHRSFTEWIDGVGYDLEVGARQGPRSAVAWRIFPQKGAECLLRITVEPHALQRMPSLIRWLPHYGYLRPLLRRYLASVVRGVEWCVATGSRVSRNQFGPHWLFSPSSDPGGWHTTSGAGCWSGWGAAEPWVVRFRSQRN
jgi:hypothetical protein